MFNKSILVAIILCACYLGAIQAGGLPLTSTLLTGAAALDTAQQLTQGLPNIGTGSGGSGLPVKVPVLSGGNSGVSLINN